MYLYTVFLNYFRIVSGTFPVSCFQTILHLPALPWRVLCSAPLAIFPAFPFLVCFLRSFFLFSFALVSLLFFLSGKWLSHLLLFTVKNLRSTRGFSAIYGRDNNWLHLRVRPISHNVHLFIKLINFVYWFDRLTSQLPAPFLLTKTFSNSNSNTNYFVAGVRDNFASLCVCTCVCVCVGCIL